MADDRYSYESRWQDRFDEDREAREREFGSGRGSREGYGQGGGFGPSGFGQGGYGQSFGPGGYGEGGYGPQAYRPPRYSEPGWADYGYGSQGYGGQGYGSGYGPGFGRAQGSFGSGQSWAGPGESRENWSGGYGQSSGWYGQSSAYGSQPGVRQGQFAGRGPKNYTRSDERILEDVSEELTRHPDIDASEIEVRVESREVTLIGTVDDRRAKRLAEDLAERVSGVTEIHNQIRVKGGLGQKISNMLRGRESESRSGAEQQSLSEGRSRSSRGS